MHRETQPTAVSLRLHGEPVLALPDGRQVALEPRAAALLALVALEPNITRLRAAGLLWPDSKDPRHNLRQQLLRFRRQFQHELLVGQDTLVLAEGVALEAGEQPLLGGLDFGEIEDFAAWLAQRRREALGARCEAGRARLAAAEAAGEIDAALREAEQLVAIDRRDEAHHRELMRLHYLAGNLSGGLAAFERLRGLLADEFGTRPSAATLQLAEVLRSAERAAVGSSLAAPAARLPVTLKRPPVMAGRAAALAAAKAALAEARVVWLEGEAGLGKSRLVAELMATWSVGAVLAGSGRPGDAGAPYATLARWLAPCLRADLGALGERTRRALRHLGGEVPAADERAALRPGDMAQAVAELLALQRGALAVLDDLHFADDATLELVTGLATAPDSPLRWLVATRPAELSPAGRALRESLIESQRIEVLALAPLDVPALAALVDALRIEGLQGAALAEPLRRHTGGNPLFVLETLKQGLHDGSLARGELPRPGNVASLIELRLGRLSEGAITLARVAAIAGVDFSIELAESAIGARAVQLAGAWQELQDAQVLRDEAFAHDLVSDAVLRGVPQVVARRMHAQCAEWLAGHAGDAARVARHWLAGGEPARAGQAFRDAAVQAMSMVRLRDAADLYAQEAQAYELAGQASKSFDARIERVASMRNLGDREQAMHELEALAANAADDSQLVRVLGEQVMTLGEWAKVARSVEVAQTLLPLARRVGNVAVLADSAGFMATGLCSLGRPQEALEVLQQLLAELEGRMEPRQLGALHANLAHVQGCLGRLRDALAAYERGRRAYELVGDQANLMVLLGNMGVTLRRGGRIAEARESARQSVTLGAKDDALIYRNAMAGVILARCEHELGEFDLALERLEAARRLFEAEAMPYHVHFAGLTLACLWLRLGQPARAMPLLAEDPADAAPWMRAERPLLQLELALALNQPRTEAALASVDELAQIDPTRTAAIRAPRLRHLEPGPRFEAAQALARQLADSEAEGVRMTVDLHWCQAALALGRMDTALECADRLVRRIGEGISPELTYLPEAWWVAHQAYAAAGRVDAAAQALQAGVEWVRQRALPHVPAPFIDSFLQRNPVNRDLLAAAASPANCGRPRS